MSLAFLRIGVCAAKVKTCYRLGRTLTW